MRNILRGAVVGALVGAGASGGCVPEELDPIIQYDEGTISEGDCDLSQIETFDAEERSPVFSGEDPYLILPGGYGRVLTNETEYLDFMFDANFASVPVPDFATYNAAATWLSIQNGCGFEIEEKHLNRKTDGSLVFDVLFFDGALGCDTLCGESHFGLVVDAVAKSESLSVCRRIRPGCPD